MNLAAFAHNILTGQYKLDRMYVRDSMRLKAQHQAEAMSQLYAGAEPGHKRPTPDQLSTPEDFKQAYERIVLIRAARQMEEDFAFFDGILGDFETYVVGSLRYIPNTGNPEADAVITDFLDYQFNEIDYSGARLDLGGLARLAVRSYKRDGECGFIPHDVGDTVKLGAISGSGGSVLIGPMITLIM